MFVLRGCAAIYVYDAIQQQLFAIVALLAVSTNIFNAGMVADTTTLKHPSQKPSIKPDSLKPSAKSDARSKKRKGKATRTTPREPQNEDTSSKVNEMDLLFDTLHTNKKKKKERDAIKSIEVKLEHKRMKKEKEKLKEHIQALETNSTL